MRIYIVLFICSFFVSPMLCQSTDIQAVKTTVNADMLALEDSLSKLGLVILTDSILLNRQQANTQFCKLFEKGMQSASAFEYPFDSLLSVSKLLSPDKAFKVFTWQFFENDDSYVYYGYIVHRDGRIVALTDKSREYFTPQFEIGDKDHWYGTLYYSMHPFVGVEGKTQYLMFGYDGNTMFEKRKVIDVLSWDEKGLPIFGADVFQASDESKGHPPVANRVLMEYFAGAKVSCDFEEIHNHVLFEHLIFKKTPYGEYLVPDGSYEGYVYEEGKWKHVSKMFHHSYGDNNFPMPEPVLTNEKKKDLFGNEYKRASKNVNRNSKLYKEARANNKKRDKEKQKEKQAENNKEN